MPRLVVLQNYTLAGSEKLATASGGVDVTGMVCTTDNIRAENSSFLGGRETAGAPTYRFHDDGDTGMFNVASDILAFSTGGTERMRINSGGCVGYRYNQSYIHLSCRRGCLY